MEGENKISNVVKTTINILLILVQISIPIMVILKINQNLIYLEVGLKILSIIVVSFILCKEEKSSFKLSWIIFIFIFPASGLVFYFLYGRVFVSKKIQTLVNEIESEKDLSFEQNEKVLEKINDKNIKKQIDLIYNLSKFPVYNNTTTKYLKTGEIMFYNMIEDIKTAKKFIFLEYFIVSDGKMYRELIETLAERAKEGVEVIFLYDEMGSLNRPPKNMCKNLEKQNIKCLPFNINKISLYDIVSFRDHRKLTIIDGNIGYAGGINICDEYINQKVVYGKWKDMAIRIEGEAVLSLTVMFLRTYKLLTGEDKNMITYRPTISLKYATGFVAPYGDGPTNREDPAENIYRNMISLATKYIYITTPYLIIDSNLIDSLTLSAKSGVDVRILTPFIPDKKIVQAETRSFYGQLIDSGVKIYEYTPGFVHGKTMVSDDLTAIVGSINLDYRSLTWNYENAIFICNTKTVLDIRNDFLETISESEQIKNKEYESRSIIKQFLNAVLRIIAPLM